MKLIFYGDEKETKWFKSRLSCPSCGVPCPRHQSPIDPHYPCNECAFNTEFGKHTNVTYNPPQSDTSDGADIVAQLKKHVERFKNCGECTFSMDGKCFFDYNCPADFDSERGKHLR